MSLNCSFFFPVLSEGYLTSDTDTIRLLLSLTPVSDSDKTAGERVGGELGSSSVLNGDGKEVPGNVPSLLLTSPSSHSQTVLIAPSSVSNPSKPAFGGAITPSPIHHPNPSPLVSATKCPPYIIIIKHNPRGIKPGSARRNSSMEKTEPRFQWRGNELSIQPTAATTIALASLQECEVLVVCSSDSIASVHSLLSSQFPSSLLTIVHNRVAPHKACPRCSHHCQGRVYRGL